MRTKFVCTHTPLKVWEKISLLSHSRRLPARKPALYDSVLYASPAPRCLLLSSTRRYFAANAEASSPSDAAALCLSHCCLYRQRCGGAATRRSGRRSRLRVGCRSRPRAAVGCSRFCASPRPQPRPRLPARRRRRSRRLRRRRLHPRGRASPHSCCADVCACQSRAPCRTRPAPFMRAHPRPCVRGARGWRPFSRGAGRGCRRRPTANCARGRRWSDWPAAGARPARSRRSGGTVLRA